MKVFHIKLQDLFEVHSTKEIIVIMWTCHLKWHVLDIPHSSNSFISMCIFHLIDDFLIKILMAFDLRWEVHLICQVSIILTGKATYNWSGRQPHQIWEDYPTSSQGGKCQHLSIGGKSTSFQHFFWDCIPEWSLAFIVNYERKFWSKCIYNHCKYI